MGGAWPGAVWLLKQQAVGLLALLVFSLVIGEIHVVFAIDQWETKRRQWQAAIYGKTGSMLTKKKTAQGAKVLKAIPHFPGLGRRVSVANNFFRNCLKQVDHKNLKGSTPDLWFKPNIVIQMPFWVRITSVQLCMQNLATSQRPAPECQWAFRRGMKLTRPENSEHSQPLFIYFHKSEFQFSSSLIVPRELQQWFMRSPDRNLAISPIC